MEVDLINNIENEQEEEYRNQLAAAQKKGAVRKRSAKKVSPHRAKSPSRKEIA